MRIEELQFNNYKETISNAIANKEEVVFYSIIPNNIVYKGKGDIDEEFARRQGYDIYNSIDFGGGIVATQGDIVLVIIQREGWEIGKNLVENLVEHLKQYGLQTQYLGNDILVDGIYKVASHSSINIGDRTIYTGIQICFHADPEIIRQICLKNSVKIPRGLSYYNINNSEILEYMLNLCENL